MGRPPEEDAPAQDHHALLFTSLYPLPWEPTRAVFNQQQYATLEERLAIDYLIPVPFFLWFRYLPSLRREMRASSRTYFPFFYIPGVLRGWNLYFLSFSIVVCITPLIKLLRARIVIASWAYPDAMACSFLQPLCRYRLFIQCLGSDVNVHGSIPRHRRQLARGFRRSEAVITVSEALAREVRSIAPSANVRPIYNGVDFERFHPLGGPRSHKRLLFIGNLLKTKGVHELIEAFSKLDDHEVTLDLIGDGPARDALQQRCNKLGIEARVTFHGRLAHCKVAKHLPQYDLLVLPSYAEGVPNVVVEALACGVPVVASRVGGIPEVVKPECGILIPPQDTPALQKALEDALGRGWDTDRLRASVSHLTWASNATQVAKLVTNQVTGQGSC